jgi:nicotinate-nucleotide adenylyltransferase
MKVGILGGSFNPPHQGHVFISKLAIKKLGLKEIWWIPALQNPLKENQKNSYQQRIKLCEEILEKEKKFRIYEDKEIYSYKLIEKLQKKYPKIQFIWIMGADNLKNLHKWKNYKIFVKKVKIAIFSRETYLLKIKQSKIWHFLKKYEPEIFLSSKLDISSSKIRENLK